MLNNSEEQTEHAQVECKSQKLRFIIRINYCIQYKNEIIIGLRNEIEGEIFTLHVEYCGTHYTKPTGHNSNVKFFVMKTNPEDTYFPRLK